MRGLPVLLFLPVFLEVPVLRLQVFILCFVVFKSLEFLQSLAFTVSPIDCYFVGVDLYFIEFLGQLQILTFSRFLICSSMSQGLVASSSLRFSELPARKPQSRFHAAVQVSSLLTRPIQFLSSATASPLLPNFPPAAFYTTGLGISMIFLILIQVTLARTSFQDLIQQDHLECDQRQDAVNFLDMIEHKDQLQEDVQILETYLAQNQSGIDLGLDLDAIMDALDKYEAAPDPLSKHNELEELYVLVTSMKNELEEDLSEIDASYYDYIKRMVDELNCRGPPRAPGFLPYEDYYPEPPPDYYEAIPETPRIKQQNAKQRLQERIRISKNTRVVRLPRRRRKNTKQYIIPRHPYEWQDDAAPAPVDEYMTDEVWVDDIDCE